MNLGTRKLVKVCVNENERHEMTFQSFVLLTHGNYGMAFTQVQALTMITHATKRRRILKCCDTSSCKKIEFLDTIVMGHT